jgi:hypothetical protein
LFLFEKFETQSEPDRQRPQFKDRVATFLLVLGPAAFVEYGLRKGAEVGLREWLLVAYLIALFAILALRYFRESPTSPIHSPMLTASLRLLLVAACAYSVILGNLRFSSDFTGQPFLFASQASMIDKAVLAMKLFGPGKTHHLVLAGTYPYYVEGKMIDSLGKSDKEIARLPVDEAVSWDGMHGVPGHAKYDFRMSILARKPDIIPDRVTWGRQDMSPFMVDSYRLIRSDDVALCVKKELTVGLESLVAGNCPSRIQ